MIQAAATKATKKPDLLLRQQIIRERAEETERLLGLPQDKAFMRFVHSLVVDRSLHEFDASDDVDGGGDKQIDVITIDEDDGEAVVYVLQTKSTPAFSSNTLIQLRNGLDWLFRRTRGEIMTLQNIALRDKIIAYRVLQNSIGQSNITVVVVHATNGLTSELSEEYLQEQRAIQAQFDNGTFARFELKCMGADELVEKLNLLEKKNRRVNVDIPIKYDANIGTVIQYSSEGLRGIVCTVAAKDIADIVNTDASGMGAIFDSNIRRFLGSKGAVNADILRTCEDPENSHLFWFLNNGITIVCDSADVVTSDSPHVKVKNMQIVNGCQTAMTIAHAAKEGKLAADTRVLTKIYVAERGDLIDKIVLTTNNQNRISARDLKSNDKVQIDMERGFKKYKLLFERRPRQYDTIPLVKGSSIIPNEFVAQSYVALVMKHPSDARRRKYKVWGELYDVIFSGEAVEPHVLSSLISKYVMQQLSKSPWRQDKDELRRKIANNGTFHLARILSFLWRKTDSWRGAKADTTSQIEKIQRETAFLKPFLNKAFEMLIEIIRSMNVADIDGLLKSHELDEKIDVTLHMP